MMNENYEDQLDDIRIAIYEQTKNMSSQERADYFNERGVSIAKQFGLQIIDGEELSIRHQEVMV
jgi:maleate cis-trans isomerase